MADPKEDGVKLFSEVKDTDPKSPETAKFIPENDNKNGISPISVDNVKIPFTGLTKEELLKYANDPFWVRIRWILFVLFWVIWLSMLFGAIFIIVITPKCHEDKPPTWWQRSPLYILDVAQLSENNPGNFSQNDSVITILKSRIDHLKDLNVESLMLTNILQTNRNAYEEVMNFTNVNYYLESTDKFQTEIIEYARSKDINVILSFVPNHSGKGEYFIKSAKRDDDYKDFYVWFPANYSQKPDTPPNNWLSVYNGSAWEWHDERKQFYLHQFKKEQPDFNFWNPAVIEFFNKVIQFWFNLGAINFHLDKAEFLFEDANFTNETKGIDPGYNMYDYGFYSHLHTCDLPQTQNALLNWSELVRNRSGFFGVSGGVREKLYIADLLTKPISLRSNFNASQLNEAIESRRASITARNVWEWKCPVSGNMSCYPPHVVDGLTVVAFLLPGTPVLRFGQEFNDSSSNVYHVKKFEEAKIAEEKVAESRLNIIKQLMKFRPLPAFTYGEYYGTVLNSNVFTFTRIKSGTPGHLVAWNLGQNETVTDFSVVPRIPENLNVLFKAGSALNDTYHLNSRNRVSSSQVSMQPMAIYIFSFVPLDNKE